MDENKEKSIKNAEKQQLRAYIPIGAPLNWEPTEGSEPDMRLVVSFTVKWLNKRMGLDYTQRFHTDPVHRFSILSRLKSEIKKAFPEIPYFFEHGEEELNTISGVYGVCFMPMLYGLPAQYSPHDWPNMKYGRHLSEEQIKNLKPFEPENNPFMEAFLKQLELMETLYGPIDGYTNFQGVLNTAFRVRGNDIFTDMTDDPGFAGYLFEHVADTTEKAAKLIQRRQRESGFYADSFCSSNCVVNMVSPVDYEKFILPHDTRLSQQFKLYGMHTCNWVVDPYVENIKKIERLEYLDFGFASNLETIGREFKNTRKNVFYNPIFLMQKSWDEIKNDAEYIKRTISPCDICLSDIDDSVSDKLINKFAELINSL